VFSTFTGPIHSHEGGEAKVEEDRRSWSPRCYESDFGKLKGGRQPLPAFPREVMVLEKSPIWAVADLNGRN